MTGSFTQVPVPPEIAECARRRAGARAARNWAAADALRAEIEGAGWKVIDQGLRFRLEPAHPPDVETAGRVRYGSSESVPSLLGEPPTALATIVLLADRWPEDLARTLDGIRTYAPIGTQVVIVANDPTPEQADALGPLDDGASVRLAGSTPEQVWTSASLGHAAAQNAGIRRSAGEVVVLLDTSIEPTGDIVTPLVDVLRNPAVAVAGGWGVRSSDLRHFDDAGPGDVDAIDGYVLAFRRSDYVTRGPLDEHFRCDQHLDIWWSLVLRDEGEPARHRRAVRIDLPATRHAYRGHLSVPEPERNRLGRRNFYRVIDRFGSRRDLLVEPAAPVRRSVSG
ncbi:MAG: glycosyltransferase family 2 protein [Candidatus Limnocylindrales bacterium]